MEEVKWECSVSDRTIGKGIHVKEYRWYGRPVKKTIVRQTWYFAKWKQGDVRFYAISVDTDYHDVDRETWNFWLQQAEKYLCPRK